MKINTEIAALGSLLDLFFVITCLTVNVVGSIVSVALFNIEYFDWSYLLFSALFLSASGVSLSSFFWCMNRRKTHH